MNIESFRIRTSTQETPVKLIKNYCVNCAHYYKEVYSNDHFYKGHFCSRMEDDVVMKDYLLSRDYCNSIRTRAEDLGVFQNGYDKIQQGREYSPGVLKI